MTWKEAAKAYRSYDFVALVAGSHEQHSTHLPLLTDSLLGEHFAKRLVTEAEGEDINILLLPTLWLGYSGEHANYPETITLRPNTLENVLIDIASSLKHHGVKRFLLINSHGGNIPVLQLAVDRIEREVGLQTHLLNFTSLGSFPKKVELKERPEPAKMNHAGALETALLLKARKDLVQMKLAVPPKLEPLAITRGWWGARYWEDFTSTGASDDPRLAEPERATLFYDKAVSNSIYALKKDLVQEKNRRARGSKKTK